VDLPDLYGQIYIENALIRTNGGLRRHLQSPPLPPDRPYPLRLRAVFQVGNKVLIEDKQVLLQAGECTAVTFDGSQAISIRVP
jgi:hypothetical protein